MAERRYGFRFSFAEGCVIVASLMSASFLVFLFGVYAGREMESHKAAAYSRTTRLAISGEEQSRLLPQEGGSSSIPKEGLEKPLSGPLFSSATQERQTTVVVVPPPKPSDPLQNIPFSTSTAPGPSQGKEPTTKSESLEKPQLRLITPALLPVKPSTIAHVPVREQQNQMKTRPVIPTTLQSKPKGGRWSVQVNATRDEGAAEKLAQQLRSQGHIPLVSKIERDGEIWYRVRVGSFANAEEARTSVERFRREGKFRQAYPASN